MEVHGEKSVRERRARAALLLAQGPAATREHVELLVEPRVAQPVCVQHLHRPCNGSAKLGERVTDLVGVGRQAQHADAAAACGGHVH